MKKIKIMLMLIMLISIGTYANGKYNTNTKNASKNITRRVKKQKNHQRFYISPKNVYIH
jgi:hypothetical protein